VPSADLTRGNFFINIPDVVNSKNRRHNKAVNGNSFGKDKLFAPEGKATEIDSV